MSSGDALRVDVGALGVAAEDHDVPAGLDREPRGCEADARRASDECRSHATHHRIAASRTVG